MNPTLPHAPGEHGEPPVTAPTRGPVYYLGRALKALASLRLTVVLLATAIALVFFGTLAQIDYGIWTVVDKYFWSWRVSVPTDLFRKFFNVFWKEAFPPESGAWTAAFPFPAGKTVGALMLTNLLAAHALRFRLTWKRAGVFLIHGGLILLFVGEFVTREFAVEQQMRIDEGSSAAYTQDTRNVELAFVDDKSSPTEDRVAVVGQKRLRETGRISHPDLPADVEVLQYMKNSDLFEVAKFETETPAGEGATFVPSKNGPHTAAYVRLRDKDTHQPLGAFVVSPLVKEQRFDAGRLSLRLSLTAEGLKIVDESPATVDRVVVVPPRRLESTKAGTRITHPDLPVEVELVQYMPHAELVEVVPVGKGKVAGNVVLIEIGEESGVATKQRGDAASAYVRLYKKGTDDVIGVYLASQLLKDQTVTLDGKSYQVSLRYAHYYKPYRIHLDKFSFDRYIGTSKAKNFSSDVRVYDENGTLVREQRIRMNEPLRYAGETFYQADYDHDTEKTTVLQVVKNPGMLNFGLFYATIDYIACAVVSTGLLLHFGIYLLGFLLRIRAPRPAAPVLAETPTPVAAGFTPSRAFPWVVAVAVVVGMLAVFGRMNPPREPYNLEAFGRMPVVDGGREKPLDSVARVNLRMISGREEYEDENGRKQPAVRWYLDVLSSGSLETRGAAWKHRVIRIDNEAVLRELDLKEREGLRYSLEEIASKFPAIAQRGAAAEKKVKGGGKLDTTEMKFKELVERINTIFQLAAERGPLLLPPATEGEQWKSLGELRTRVRQIVAGDVDAELRITEDQIAKMPKEQRAAFNDRRENEIDRREKDALAAFPAAANWSRLLTAYRDKNPTEFNAAVDEYRTVHAAGVLDKRPGRDAFARLLYAPFNAVGSMRVEAMYNRFAPFYQCTGLYVFGFVLAVIGYFLSVAEKPAWAAALRRAATFTLLLTLAGHTLALLTRMYVMDRPLVFVTNLYSSAIFIGWGCVALCLVLERVFPIGIGNAVAALLGLVTCIVAHNLASEDTLEMMQAVLDTNFWLATHVTTVTLGYTATFVAGFLGAIYVEQMLATVIRDSFKSTGEPTVGALFAFGVAVLGAVAIPLAVVAFITTAVDKFELVNSMLLWTAFCLVAAAGAVYALVLLLLRVSSEGVDGNGRPLAGQVPALAQPLVGAALTPESSKMLGQMIYGVLCFATLLSFVGTVLGGIWADQSWGRFWGWDPKENGAVLIVLWNSLILHARWCGLVKERGVAALALFGNAITAWSWFGTNQLGIGLHAYGFDTRLADGCFNFWLSQLFILAVGAAIPRRFWASATRAGAAAQAASEKAAPVVPLAAPAAAHTNTFTPPSTNGNAPVAPANGTANGHPRRDRRKHGKRR